MRIWDLPVNHLCRKHLLGEHRELHAIWVVLTKNKKGYRNHPETKRWEGKLKALYKRHDEEVREMIERGYSHLSILDNNLATGEDIQEEMINSIQEQMELLKKKPCDCYMENSRQKE